MAARYGLLDFYDLAGCIASDLCLTNVQVADAASYRIIVTNAFGSATSTVATLTVTTLRRVMAIGNLYAAAILTMALQTRLVSTLQAPSRRITGQPIANW
ncbi:MAG: hypothetical protein NT154_24035 [Verrucomicrobia bacterium]|nr:hypothetical protein [Verrucomicrobiota bacterium]